MILITKSYFDRRNVFIIWPILKSSDYYTPKQRKRFIWPTNLKKL